jgi:hypothetical protein
MTIRGGGDPFVRLGPPPRSLAAEANGCFMVGSDADPTEYKVAARSTRPNGGLPSVRTPHQQYENPVHIRGDRQGEISLTSKSPYKFWPCTPARLKGSIVPLPHIPALPASMLSCPIPLKNS